MVEHDLGGWSWQMEVALVEAEIADLEATLKERKAYLTEIKLVQALENRLMT